MKYQELKDGIKRHLNAAAEDFFTVGYYLRQISENALFLEDGYESVWAFAKGEYGLSASSASRFMAINSKFSIDGGQTMEQKYIGMGVSKLQEMLTLPDEDLEKITQETTVKEIRAMKAAKNPPLSFFGWPETKRPEGSLLTTKGCSPEGTGKGGHDCFSCSRDCAIRQEARYCYTAPMGNPYPCTFTKEDREQVAKFSTNRDRCLHLHPELAPKRAGDGEPEPCCLLCEAFKEGACSMVCCDVAKKERERKQKEYEREQARIAAERKKEKEEKRKAEEAARRNIREDEWRVLYRYLVTEDMEEITAAALKDKHGKSYHGCTVSEFGRNGNLDCSPRGIRIDANGVRTKEETWAAAAKALKQIHKEERVKRPAPERSEVDIIDAEFTEISTETADQPEEATGARAAFEKAKTKLQARQEPEVEILDRQPWKTYSARDVKNLLEKQRFDLEQYESLNEGSSESEQIPEGTLRKAQILTDALQMLFKELERQEAAEDDEETD